MCSIIPSVRQISGEPIPSQLLHRAFSVFLINDRGELLLLKRASGKYHSGGLWANACCSHPRIGEETIPSAEARLTEELGVTCPLREIGCFVYLHRFHDALYEYEYDHVLLGRHCGPFTPDSEEIEELRWVTPAQLTEELRTHPGALCLMVPHRRAHGAAVSGIT